MECGVVALAALRFRAAATKNALQQPAFASLQICASVMTAESSQRKHATQTWRPDASCHDEVSADSHRSICYSDLKDYR